MTQRKHRAGRNSLAMVREAMAADADWLRPLIREGLPQVREAEMV